MSIWQVLQPPTQVKPSSAGALLERLGETISQTMMQRRQYAQQQQQGSALSRLMSGQELPQEEQERLMGQLSPEMQMKYLEAQSKRKEAPVQPKLSSATQQYIKDIDKAAPAAESVIYAGQRLMELADKMGGIRGTWGKHAPQMFKPADIAEFESGLNDFLSLYKAMFPRGITQEEFKILKKEALPDPALSPEANKKRIQRFMDKAQKIVDKQQRLIDVQEQYGYVPENVRALVSKEQETGFESMPPASKYSPGRKIRDNEKHKMYQTDGKTWKEIPWEEKK